MERRSCGERRVKERNRFAQELGREIDQRGRQDGSCGHADAGGFRFHILKMNECDGGRTGRRPHGIFEAPRSAVGVWLISSEGGHLHGDKACTVFWYDERRGTLLML